MDISPTLILDESEPLSKAISNILRTSKPVIVLKNGSYYGVVDGRNVNYNIPDISKVKCGKASVRMPALSKTSTIVERLNHFVAGHFKALPVLDENAQPIGITTRFDLLKDLINANLIPKIRVSEVMSSPVVKVDSSVSIGTARRAMREHRTQRLLVMKGGYPYTLITTFDLAGLVLKPRGRKERVMIAQDITGLGELAVEELALHERVIKEEAGVSLHAAIQKMLDNGVSSLLITSDRKPVGIITAADVFKKVIDLFNEEELEITISGLGRPEIQHYNTVKEKITNVVERFAKIFRIHNVAVHFKKKKSLYTASVFLKLNRGHIATTYEDYDFKVTVDGLVKELETLLEKKKGLVKYPKGRRASIAMKGDISGRRIRPPRKRPSYA